MVKEKVNRISLFKIVCCGKGCDRDIIGKDEEEAIQIAKNQKWQLREDGDFCPGCVAMGDDRNVYKRFEPLDLTKVSTKSLLIEIDKRERKLLKKKKKKENKLRWLSW